MRYLVSIVIVSLIGLVSPAWSCDEKLCASLVSKCLLLKSCECNMVDKANCTCCKDCSRCLSKLYMECCDCVGMCRPVNMLDSKQSLERTSSIEELSNPIVELFSALTEDEDPEKRWSIYKYPAHLDLLYFNPPGLDLPQTSSNIGSSEDHVTRESGMNCTVAYHSQCMSLNKCKASCQSMGAARYRWFHQYGCCECIGSTCLDYGKGEPLCMWCPLISGETEDSGYFYNEYNYEEFYPEPADDGKADLYKEKTQEKQTNLNAKSLNGDSINIVDEN